VSVPVEQRHLQPQAELAAEFSSLKRILVGDPLFIVG